MNTAPDKQWGIRNVHTGAFCDHHRFNRREDAEAFYRAQWHPEYLAAHQVQAMPRTYEQAPPGAGGEGSKDG